MTKTFTAAQVSRLTDILNTSITDANMALNGEWDCSTREGREAFNDQIDLIEEGLTILNEPLVVDGSITND